MAAPVLNEEQRLKVVEWLANGFPNPLIRALLEAHGWPSLADQSITHYREQHKQTIEARRRERLEGAYDAGLARVQARVKALVAHAAKLEAVMWLPDDKGKLHNEKAWRETLDDIAKEMGHRRLGIDLAQAFGKMTEAELDEYITRGERALAEGSEGDAPGALTGDTE